MDHATQHEVELAEGTRVHRLPLGYAADRWWLTFVVSGPVFDHPVGNGGPDYFATLHSLVSLDGPGGRVSAPTASGGGDGLHHVVVELRGLPWVRITYMDGGRPVAEETLELPPR